ncbi:MAG TPA: zinc-binding dehydrogenase, partial [Sphingomicrobium sp.]|nr:zinc-binding dehydrogenase [Sphingomicrobium sp.]
VIGSARGAAKYDFVRSLGADAVVDYTAGPIVKSLAAAAKAVGDGGIDVYFDNVGGDHLDAALALARRDARFAICGMIDAYNSGEPTSLRYIMRIIAMRIRLQGFIFTDYQPRLGEFYRDMGRWIASGEVKSRDTIVEGLERMPDAFLGLFEGANTGKMLVRL